MTDPAARPPSLVRRLVRGSAALLATLVCFTSALGVGLVLHLDTALGRRVVATLTSRFLSDLFRGSFEIATFTDLQIDHLSTPRVVLRDEDGNRVIELEQLKVNADAIEIVRDLVRSDDKLTIVLPHIRVERAETSVLPHGDTQELTLVRALTPRSTALDEEAVNLEEPGPYVRVWMPLIEIGQATGEIVIEDVPPFRARVAHVKARLLATPKGVALDIARFGANLYGFGGHDARGTAALELRAPGPIEAQFEGFYGDVELQARGRIVRNRVEVSADIPGASPAAMKKLVPDWPLRERIAGHVEAKGELPEVDVKASLTLRKASIEAKGPVWLTDPLRAKLAVRGRDLDLRALFADAPATDVSFDSELSVGSENDRMVVDVRAHTEPTVIDGQPVPSVDLEGRLAEGAFNGTGQIHEPGLPMRASFAVAESGAIDLDLSAPAFSLSGSRRWPPVAEGRASARVRAHLDGSALDARIDADVSDFGAEGAKLDSAMVHARVRGSIDRPERLTVQGGIEGTALRVSGLSFDDAALDVKGTPEGADFDLSLGRETGSTAHAAGRIRVLPRLVLEDVALALRRGKLAARGRIDRLDPDRGVVKLEDVEITGAGAPVRGWVTIGPGLVEGSVDGDGVNLSTLSRAFGLPRGMAEGTLRVSADVTAGSDVTRARVRLALADATIRHIGGLNGNLSATLDDRRLQAEASGLVRGVAGFGSTLEGTLDGPALQASSWERLIGRLDLRVSDIQLPLLGLVLGEKSPIRNVAGTGFVQLLVERKDPEILPNVFATVATRDLALDVVRDGRATVDIRRIDVHATGALNGATGDSTGTTLLIDDEGDLLTATGAVRVDLPRLVEDPGGALEQLMDTPLDVVVNTTPRPIEKLPEIVRPEGLSGTVSASVQVKGSLRRPTLFASARAERLVAADAPVDRPIDVEAQGQYEPERDAFSVRATAALRKAPIAQAAIVGRIRGGDSAVPWEGRARVDLHGLPLNLFDASREDRFTGRLFGSATLERAPQASTLGADIDLKRVRVGETDLGDGNLSVSTQGTRLSARAVLESSNGRFSAQARTDLGWDGALPAPASREPISGTLQAESFEAAALAPLVEGALRRISGKIDAALKFEVARHQNKEGETWDAAIEGNAAVAEGAILIETLGLEIRDLSLSASAQRVGDVTLIRIADIEGKARSPKPNIEGSAELQLRGGELSRGSAVLILDDVPLPIEGVSQGRGTGQVRAVLERRPDRYDVDLDIPKLTVRLPKASSRDVIDLEQNPDVLVLQHQKDDKEEVGGEPATPWRMALELGKNVRIRRSDVDIGVTGEPVFLFGEEMTASGSIELSAGGRVPVFGKVFIIQDGSTIYFDTGQPGNPRLDVTAQWESPGAMMVFVDVTGTANNLKIHLRSDPPMPEDQVFALLLGGSPTQSSSSSSTATTERDSSAAAGAVAIGGGVAALGVNELLGDQPVELRIDTTDQSRPRYTAAVRVGSNLWFEASTYEQTIDQGGATNRNIFSGTIDYRFSPRWSLRTEVGTAGGAVDLLWQYRY